MGMNSLQKKGVWKQDKNTKSEGEGAQNKWNYLSMQQDHFTWQDFLKKIRLCLI